MEASASVGPQTRVEVLHGICHALASAESVPEATGSTIRWVEALLGPRVSVRVALPDRRGRLRVVAANGDGGDAGRKRSARRRGVYEEKVPLVLGLRKPRGTALALVPLVSRGRSVGVLEVLAPRDRLDKLGKTLEAVASQSAIALSQLRQRQGFEEQILALSGAAVLVRELVRAETLPQATRAAMRLCFGLLQAPVGAWTTAGERRRLEFMGVRGMGRARREELRRVLPSIPRWEHASAEKRREALDRFSAAVGTEDVAVIDGGDAVLLAGSESVLLPSLEVVGSLFQDVLRRLGAMDRAQRRSDRMDMGIAWTAHEVRGPLLAAKAAIEHLLEGTGDLGNDRDLLSRSQRELDQLAGLVDAVLRWAVGASPLHRRSVDLGRIVGEVAESCSLQVGEGRVELRPDDKIQVRADPDQLRGAIANLIRNALEYSPRGSPVEVEVSARDEMATVWIHDQGPGVPAPERDSIFDPLVRGAAGRSTRVGKGLGLFIARRVLEAHGGGVWLEPSRTGCTFRAEIPLNGGGGHGRGVEDPRGGARLARPDR